MDDASVFQDESAKPTDKDLAAKLDVAYDFWKQIHRTVLNKYPRGLAEWNYPGNKYGWNFRIKDNKRAIVYLLPRDKYFKVAFVFGQKATDEVLKSKVASAIKKN